MATASEVSVDDLESSIFKRIIISPEAAQAVLAMRIAPQDERRMEELMDLGNKGLAGAREQTEMEAFRRVGSKLAVMQANARVQLSKAAGGPHAA